MESKQRNGEQLSEDLPETASSGTHSRAQGPRSSLNSWQSWQSWEADDSNMSDDVPQIRKVVAGAHQVPLAWRKKALQARHKKILFSKMPESDALFSGVIMNKAQLARFALSQRSLYFFSSENRFREACVRLVRSTWFSPLTSFLIFLNCVFLGIRQPTEPETWKVERGCPWPRPGSGQVSSDAAEGAPVAEARGVGHEL
ncbi:hypothetical protein CYMTET_28172 [Cymbomonas tetramitiformis]|uniref:Uncharacterized protein n=1 Tax=Cymbomonas tetramitiformis TaxID=36881 RepID=A0AAE0FPV6_9CHLO|nr:hypothetical protein CYMTET_28172 [Cymbomonas tetramitiformis]